jgi:replicative DNA helicase
MSGSEIIQRVLSAEAQVLLARLRDNTCEPEDWSRLAAAMPAVRDAPLWVDDTPGLTTLELRAKARRVAQRTGGLGLVVVDYLQLMRGDRRAETRQQEVSALSRALKLLAKEMDVPLIAVSQLNRAAESRQDKRPVMSDLRESGSLEQDADMVVLLHRPPPPTRRRPARPNLSSRNTATAPGAPSRSCSEATTPASHQWPPGCSEALARALGRPAMRPFTPEQDHRSRR